MKQVVLLLAAIGAVACADARATAVGDSTPVRDTTATVAKTPQIPAAIQALAGTYDLATTMTKFTFETAPNDYPDCPNKGELYCVHERAPSDSASLGGTVVLTPAISSIDSQAYLAQTAALVGRFCDSISVAAGKTVDCVHLGPATSGIYSQGGLEIAKTFPAPDDVSGSWRVPNDDNLGPHVEIVDAHASADSIYGTLFWELTTGRSPPTYYANFVLRRRH